MSALRIAESRPLVIRVRRAKAVGTGNGKDLAVFTDGELHVDGFHLNVLSDKVCAVKLAITFFILDG